LLAGFYASWGLRLTGLEPLFHYEDLHLHATTMITIEAIPKSTMLSILFAPPIGWQDGRSKIAAALITIKKKQHIISYFATVGTEGLAEQNRHFCLAFWCHPVTLTR